ncbi:unnamed protein product [Aureobasidium vineae]|uniref:F-box domain-containing protein n=1 Tax=Aureobasidium vineae TaxID=2773715 RepID=A0A9N8P556_9PEZI|nr:unnamed protein product [Aureobasidium vineae]
MANFLDLPPEIRAKIYNALLVDPINDRDKIMFTLDKDGQQNWDRVTELLPPDDESTTEALPKPVKSSVKHLDYSDLWSLARASRLVYAEATPIVYANARLEYTFGERPDVIRGPTLLHEFLDKLPSASCALYRHLAIVNNNYASGESLSAKDMNILVDLINSKLPNLSSLEIRAIDPEIETCSNDEDTGFVQDALRIITAARPVARLASCPKVSLKPRLSFYLADSITYDPEITLIMTVLETLMAMEVVPTLVDIRDWRRQAQIHYATTCQQGDCLQLTSGMRSRMIGYQQTACEEEGDDMEAKLISHGEVLKRIENCKHWRMILNGQLRNASD